jgi:hypothetical protein
LESDPAVRFRSGGCDSIDSEGRIEERHYGSFALDIRETQDRRGRKEIEYRFLRSLFTYRWQWDVNFTRSAFSFSWIDEILAPPFYDKAWSAPPSQICRACAFGAAPTAPPAELEAGVLPKRA